MGRLSAQQREAWRGLLRVHSHVIAQQGALVQRRHGLTLTEWEVLLALAQAPQSQLRIGDLADVALLTTGGVTRLVTRLQQRGLVARVAHPADRRGVAVALTAEGSTVYREAGQELTALLRTVFLDRLGPDQLDALAAAWEAVVPGAATDDDTRWAARRRSAR